MQAGFYITPILYPLTMIVNPFFQKLILMNPMAQSIQDARYMLVSHNEQVLTIARVFDSKVYYLIPIGISVAMLVIGIWYFKREAKDFAENL